MPRALPKLFNTSEPVPFEDGGDVYFDYFDELQTYQDTFGSLPTDWPVPDNQIIDYLPEPIINRNPTPQPLPYPQASVTPTPQAPRPEINWDNVLGVPANGIEWQWDANGQLILYDYSTGLRIPVNYDNYQAEYPAAYETIMRTRQYQNRPVFQPDVQLDPSQVIFRGPY